MRPGTREIPALRVIPAARRLAHPLHPSTRIGLIAPRNEQVRMEFGTVRMTVKWCVPPGEAQVIIAALQTWMQETRGMPGCTGCSFSTEMGALAVIRYVEAWKGEADMRRQVQSDRFANLLELIERATEYPVIEFELPGGVRGLEYAELLRR
jgi:quinol monooxygenase YgiN